jgi:hypothetical protein
LTLILKNRRFCQFWDFNENLKFFDEIGHQSLKIENFIDFGFF